MIPGQGVANRPRLEIPMDVRSNPETQATSEQTEAPVAQGGTHQEAKPERAEQQVDNKLPPKEIQTIAEGLFDIVTSNDLPPETKKLEQAALLERIEDSLQRQAVQQALLLLSLDVPQVQLNVAKNIFEKLTAEQQPAFLAALKGLNLPIPDSIANSIASTPTHERRPTPESFGIPREVGDAALKLIKLQEKAPDLTDLFVTEGAEKEKLMNAQEVHEQKIADVYERIQKLYDPATYHALITFDILNMINDKLAPETQITIRSQMLARLSTQAQTIFYGIEEYIASLSVSELEPNSETGDDSNNPAQRRLQKL